MRPKALLLTTRADNDEMEELAWSLGYDLVATVFQNRGRPDPRYHIGRGKLADARDLAKALEVDCVIVNEALKPSQMFNLHDFIVNGWEDAEARVPDDLEDAILREDEDEDARADAGAEERSEGAANGARERDASFLNRAEAAEGAGHVDERPPEVFDRVRVILEIFSERARSQEARLQVELARLQYEAPLVKEFIHLLRKGERPGFLAGGEHEIQQYYDMINRRMAKIREELEKVRRERDVRRKHRRRSGFHLVSLAGYTNAGKSTMLRALSAPRVDAGRGRGARPRRGSTPLQGADILVENRYFSTLGTKTRRAESGKREILVTDTVGFIEDLPPWIVRAFHSTLEEIALADVIALVVDASDPYPELARKIGSSLSTLWEFDSQQHRENGHGGAGDADAGPDAAAHANAGAATADGRDEAPPSAHAPWAPGASGAGSGGATAGAGDAGAAKAGAAETGAGDADARDADARDADARDADADAPEAGAGNAAAAKAGEASSNGTSPLVRADASAASIARTDAEDASPDAAASDGGTSGASGAPETSGPRHHANGGKRAEPSRPEDVQARQPAFARDAARGPQSLAPIVIVLNKVDAVPVTVFEDNLRRLKEDGLIGENWVGVSARAAKGLDAFYEAVYALLPGYAAFTLELPPSPETEAFLAWLYEETDVTDVQRSNVVRVSVEAKAELTDQIHSRAIAADGRVLESSSVT